MVEEIKPRNRNVAHLWCDKRVIRLFRHNTEKRTYRQLRDVYLALCEIDSDFSEERNSPTKSITSLTKTCTTYTGMDQAVVSRILQTLRMLQIINYGRKYNNKNQVIGSFLEMYEWMGEDFYLKNLPKTLIWLDQYKGRPIDIKNNIDKSILDVSKNSSKEEGLYSLNKNLKNNSASDEALVSFNTNLSHKEDNSLSEKDNSLSEKETGNALSSKGKLLRQTKAQQLRNAPLSVPAKLKLSFTIPKVIQLIIDHWGSCGLKQNKPNTKILKQTIRAIAQLKQGTFFNNKLAFEEYKDYKFTDEEIKKSIDHFAMAATLDDYVPEPGPYKDRLAKMDLITFLHNPFNNSSENKSLFIKCLLHPPKLLSSTAASVKDLDPDVTAMYRNWWENDILDQWLRTNEKITPADESNFRRATAHTLQFMEKYKSRFNTSASGIERLCPGVIAKYVCQAIEEDIRGKGNYGFKEITTGWLCTSTTWNKRVLGYFMDQGFIIDHPFSIYDREHKEAVVDTSQYYDPREDYGLYDEEDTRP